MAVFCTCSETKLPLCVTENRRPFNKIENSLLCGPIYFELNYQVSGVFVYLIIF